MSIVFRFLVLWFVGVAARAPAPQPSRSYALTGVTIIDGGHDAPVPNQTVVVVDGMIADVYPDGFKVLADSVVTIRLRGKFLLPGLIDTHVHMATDPSGTDNRTATFFQRPPYDGFVERGSCGWNAL